MRWVARFALVAVLVLSGCYTLGPITPTYMKGVHSLSVPIFANKSFEPQVQAVITDTFIKELQTDGTYPITGEDEADAIVYGTVTDVIRTQTKSVSWRCFGIRRVPNYAEDPHPSASGR